MLFYVVVAAGKFDLGKLRQQGWLFDMGAGMGSHQAWYKFYSYLGVYNSIYSSMRAKSMTGIDINLIRFGPLWSTLPTQFALYAFKDYLC